MASIDAVVSASPLTATQCNTACAGESQRCLIAVLEGSVAGFIVFTAVLDEATILALSVRDRCQNAGVGRHLLGSALLVLKEIGLARCLLEVRVSNDAARHLYTTAGFSVDGQRKNYYAGQAGAREDAVLMSLRLQEDADECAGN